MCNETRKLTDRNRISGDLIDCLALVGFYLSLAVAIIGPATSSAATSNPTATSNPREHIIGPMTALRDGLIVGDKPEPITVVIDIPRDPYLLPETVHLFQQAPIGGLREDFGRLYDDGTHGDENAGDHRFTAKFTLPTDVPADFRFVASVRFSDQPSPIVTRPILVSVFKRPSPAEIKETNEIMATMGTVDAMEKELMPKYGLKITQSKILVFLKSQPNVADAHLSDATTITITFTNGVSRDSRDIFNNPPGTLSFRP